MARRVAEVRLGPLSCDRTGECDLRYFLAYFAFKMRADIYINSRLYMNSQTHCKPTSDGGTGFFLALANIATKTNREFIIHT